MLMDKNNKKRVHEDIEAEEKRGQPGRISEKVTSTKKIMRRIIRI